MPISRPYSRNSVVALAAALIATAALAQDNARTGIENEGPSALERLERSVARQKNADDMKAPSLPSPDGFPAERRRAFEGLGRYGSHADMEARARAAAAAGQASLAAEREAQAKRLRQALGLEPGEEKALAKAAPAARAKAWVPVLFVSSSMPIRTLRNYAEQLERVRGVMAFRGMPGGLHKVGPMAKLTAEILRLHPGCEGPACAMRDVQLIVDPILYRQHAVGRVPALALVPGDPAQAYCEREEDSPRAHFLVFGDSALAGLLEEYARLGGKEEVRDAQARLGAS
ncbi:MAG: conjugal transfer protein TrbC [Sphingopyxis terrae]|nr:conjugal transfer protein TrbC [Sphingopyxis terrae]